ncbi:hypothetical protein I5M27_11935 [Adhaeribacter sp. BT258]|uniref:Outer membrane protein beta-barrel domain-containing protein n=1 Tax=Adhaeribacter terrigena TaxID=2793070 RepID=A0ABS1C577_9BACT|nr:hypothetical protein [Adhaeribacter terrigena]MBK0403700.1 hypothetical protein [Adhaeribacter terrigena]
MKRILFLVAAALSFSANAQTQFPEKLSIGLQAGRTTARGLQVEGQQPNTLEPIRTHDLSKGVFLQYELTENFYARSSFKKAALSLEHNYQPSFYEGYTYGIGPDNKQLELSAGYRKKIYKGLRFTSSLGATFIDFERWNLPVQKASKAGPYDVTVSVDQVKERSVLLNGAIGLEYKTRRDNAFLLELAYYKGFSTLWQFDFQMDAEIDEAPYQIHYESSLKTKGDYLELRLGYRMPLQKFVNLYSAIKNPKPKPDPEPDYMQQSRFNGKYWGLEIGGQNFYSNQVQEFPDHTLRMKPSHVTPSLTYFQGYQFKNRLMLEGGLRLGASSVSVDAIETLGLGSSWSLLMLTAPVSVKYALPLLKDKIHLVPETGFWMSYIHKVAETDYYGSPNTSGPYSNIISHLKGLGQDYNIGYHGGLSLLGRVGKHSELGIGYRFSDNFSNKPFALHEIAYDYNGVPQPTIVSTARLQNAAVTISYRKFFRKNNL